MSVKPDVYARLDRIKELWRELERTRRRTPRYDELIGEIHSESLAYQSLLAEQDDLAGQRTRIDRDVRQNDVDRRPTDRRHIAQRKK